MSHSPFCFKIETSLLNVFQEIEQPPTEPQTDMCKFLSSISILSVSDSFLRIYYILVSKTGVPDSQSEYSHMKEMARVEELGRMLTDIQSTLNKASSEYSHPLYYG